jgi:hypothetical protein
MATQMPLERICQLAAYHRMTIAALTQGKPIELLRIRLSAGIQTLSPHCTIPNTSIPI